MIGAELRRGFYGKIPARGDFVRAGLPRGFVDAWDGWLQRVLPESRARLGEAWLGAWLEAPVWRFALPAGLCGPDAAIGIWMPSVDRAGRHFPLTLAMVAPGVEIAELLCAHTAWLGRAERAGRAALEQDLAPGPLADALTEGEDMAEPEAETGLLAPMPDAALWWTEGGPRVPAGARSSAGLPRPDEFTAMLAMPIPAGVP